MTKEQREKLAEAVIKILRREWINEFTDNDAVRIYDFCNDEVDDIMSIPFPFSNYDIETVAMEFELKYG